MRLTPLARVRSVALAGVLALLAARIGSAQTPQLGESVPTADRNLSSSDLGFFRARYGVVIRRGSEQDSGPGLSYAGRTPDDVGVSGEYFFGVFGLEASLQREGFALFDGTEKVTSGPLVRGEVGPAARVSLGLLRLEALVGYAYAQLPAFGNSAAPVFAPAERHSLALRGGAHLSLPAGVFAEAEGEYFVPLVVSEAGAPASSFGFVAGASLGYRFASTERLGFGIVLNYQYVHDEVATTDRTLLARQTLSRLGVALELSFLEPKKIMAPRVGGLLIRVLDETERPVSRATVTLTDPGGASLKPLTTDRTGVVTVRDLPPGSFTGTATAEGYLPTSGTMTVVAGREQSLTLSAKQAPRVGSLALTLRDKEDAMPVANASIRVGDQTFTSNEGGKIVVPELPEGPVAVAVSANGYQPASEVASIVRAQTSDVSLAMIKLEKKIPAIVTGHVRSTNGGRPIAATLEIPEAHLKIQAESNGAFRVQLPRGSYRVIIAAHGYLTQTKSVTVKDGDEAIFNVDLHPESHR